MITEANLLGVPSRTPHQLRHFFRLFVLLEDACHELDVVASLQVTSSGAGSTYREALQGQSTLRDSITRTKTEISGFEQILTLTVVSLHPDNHSTSMRSLKERREWQKWYDRAPCKFSEYKKYIYTIGVGGSRVG